MDMGLSTQDFGMETLVFHEVCTLYAEYILERPRYNMAFDNFWSCGHSPLEVLLCRLGVRRQADHNISCKTTPHQLRISYNPVAADHSSPLQFLDTPQASRGR